MPVISVPWDDNPLTISLPEQWQLLRSASSSPRATAENWPDRMAAALAKPASGPSLGQLLAACQKGKVALIVEDDTRHSPLMEILPILLREVRHSGLSDEQIEIVFATGMHLPMTPQQVQAKIGMETSILRWRCNPWETDKAYVTVGRIGRVDARIDRGVLQADLRILVSAVTPHLQAGFGGGYKMFFPGCAGLETIRALHRLGVARRPRQLIGAEADRNVMRQAIDAAGLTVDKAHGHTFSLQYLLDESDRPANIATGQVVPAQRMLAKQAAVAFGVFTEQPADVVITNAYPRDLDLWQCLKSVANTLWAARPGGVIICLARCQAGLHGMKPPRRWPFNPAWTRRLVRLLHPEPLAALLTRVVPRLAGDAAFFIRLALQSLYRNPILLVSPAMCQAACRFPGLLIYPSIDEALAAATPLLDDGPQRVTVFPAGGITYPVPAPLVQA